MLYVNLLVEDDLSEAVAKKILRRFEPNLEVPAVYGRSGFGYIKKHASKFNAAAKFANYFAITDLDRHECPAGLVEEWVGPPDSRFLNLRVAVREIESWVMADRGRFCEFMGIDLSLVPPRPEVIEDPKAAVIELARRSRKSAIRSEIPPKQGRIQRIGPGYNAHLVEFVSKKWRLSEARRHAPSLERAVGSLRKLRIQPHNK